MFLKYANTRAQVLRHFGVGTWKQGKQLKIVSCSAYRPDTSDVRPDASGMRLDVSEVSIRCELSLQDSEFLVRCNPSGENAVTSSSLSLRPLHTGRVRVERPVQTQF